MLARLGILMTALLALPVLAGCATPAPPMLPPEAHDLENVARGFGEAPLGPAQASTGYRQRLRLFLWPPRRQRVAIRIDTDLSGRSFGYFVRQEPSGQGHDWEVSERRRFGVSPADLAALDGLVAKSKLWTIYPEYWHLREGDICVDGVEMVMERATAEGYRVSEANAQCTAPASMLAVAAKMVDMADPGDTQVAGWLH
jgi:hypothetical protein